ncbi:anti-sigma factor [Streptomyces sp. NPDC006552]|uniref:anti-sigma factor n=1 Tax=Streptomyces sp. NPDC006552 TaxID=3157179 RepID=UPI0033A57123
MSVTADLHTLTGAYALDALDARERDRFERHLARCASCDQEVLELSATAARLGHAVSVPAPARLKAQVLDRTARMRQGSLVDRVTALSRRVLCGRAAAWALASCVVGMAALGGATLWQHEQAGAARQVVRAGRERGEQVAAVLGAPDAAVVTAAVGQEARGAVVVSRARGQAVFTSAGLAKPPPGTVYQLWFADGGRMRPAGLMAPARTDQSVLMSGAVGSASAVTVTLEPAGGSPQPTTRPLAVLRLPA